MDASFFRLFFLLVKILTKDGKEGSVGIYLPCNHNQKILGLVGVDEDKIELSPPLKHTHTNNSSWRTLAGRYPNLPTVPACWKATTMDLNV